jgi:hypothetical protein
MVTGSFLAAGVYVLQLGEEWRCFPGLRGSMIRDDAEMEAPFLCTVSDDCPASVLCDCPTFSNVCGV